MTEIRQQFSLGILPIDRRFNFVSVGPSEITRQPLGCVRRGRPAAAQLTPSRVAFPSQILCPINGVGPNVDDFAIAQCAWVPHFDGLTIEHDCPSSLRNVTPDAILYRQAKSARKPKQRGQRENEARRAGTLVGRPFLSARTARLTLLSMTPAKKIALQYLAVLVGSALSSVLRNLFKILYARFHRCNPLLSLRFCFAAEPTARQPMPRAVRGVLATLRP
jgi:hypothetical protein